MTKKTTVAVLFGGRSSEHSISSATAGGVLGAIDRERFEVIPVGITTAGAFVLERDEPEAFAMVGDRLPGVRDDGSRVLWPEDATSRTLRVRRPDGAIDVLGEVDVVFPILHGRFGEDGTVQGLLELLGLPYVGSGVLGSALGMDKHFTKTALAAAGIAVAPWRTLTRASLAADPGAAARAFEELGSPVFVKPARAGSSVGVSRVADVAELPRAIEVAFAEDRTVLVEAAVAGRELEMAVLGGRGDGAPRTSVAGEVVISGGGFYDFASKYLGGDGATTVCPAPLADDELAAFADIARRAFLAVDARGLARVDVFLGEDGFVVNEVNTMPGFTPISMFPICWRESGLAYPDLIAELIELGMKTER